MSGWSNSEENDNFKLQPTDFTLTNVAEEFPAENATFNEPLYTPAPAPPAVENHFYSRLGFPVGEYFAGEKRLYQQRQ